MMIASEAEASITSDSLMPPVCEWMMLIATCSCGTLAISSWSASSEPATSALRTMLSSLMSPSWARGEDLLEADLARLAAGQRLGLEPVGALLGELAGAAVVLDRLDELAGVGDAVEAEHLDRHPRPGALDPLAGEVVHRPHPAPLRAGDQRVADAAACRAGPGR